MEDYEAILSRDNTCFMNIDSQAIAALHNIDYDNSARKQKISTESGEVSNANEGMSDNKRRSSTPEATTSKRARFDYDDDSPTSSPMFPLFEDSPKPSQNPEDSFLWDDINSEEIAAAYNFEYSRPKLRKSKSSTSADTTQTTPKSSPLTRSKTFPKAKSQNGLYRSIDIASPGNREKLSVSTILNTDNTFLLQIDCEAIAAQNNIDLNVPPKQPDDLTNLTQCLVEANEILHSQVAQCIKAYRGEEVDIKENNETSAVFIKPKVPKAKLTAKTSSESSNSFCGLTQQQKKFILETKGIQDLYDWQYECISLPTVRNRKNLIYALPTSGGKSLVAEILILREILVHKKNAILILPFVSIVQEKIQDFVPFALHYNFLVEEYCSGKGTIPPTKRREKHSLYIATTEKCQILIDSLIESKRLNEIGLVVVDELHMVGDKQRGHNLELLMSKLVYLTASNMANIQIIGMSATIENLTEVAKFINADLYCRDFRPVELKEYIKMGDNLLYIDPKAKSIDGTFKLEKSNVGSDLTAQQRQRDPDHISAFVMETISMNSSCLIFCASKKSCENVSLLLADVLPRDIRDLNREEKKNLIETLKSDSGGKICETLHRTIPWGVAYHHSGLTADERRRIEDAFRSGTINVICCTSTLAAGVNLPAGRVIIRSPNIGRDFIPLSTYKQMIGRAGRAGKSEIGDSILICNRNDHQKVISLLTSRMDYTISNYITDPNNFYTMILNLLSNKLVKTFEGIEEFTTFTLAAVQQFNYDRNVFGSIKEIIQNLYLEGAIEHRFKSSGQFEPFLEFEKDGKRVVIYPDDDLVISKLGEAAVNSGKSLVEAQKIEETLRKANESLVLTQPLHLLYIVAPKEIYESINVNHRTFSELFFELELYDKSIIETAKVLGISVAQVGKMMVKSITTLPESQIRRIKRFYVAMMLYSLWRGDDAFDVANKFNVDRGVVSKLMSSASAESYAVFKFCEHFDEFWVFKEIFEVFSKRLQHCCSTELLPLMELPGVKIGRAKMLYAAGIKTIMDVASLVPEDLTRMIKFINTQQATKMIRAAKYALKAEFDNNREKLLDMKDVLDKK